MTGQPLRLETATSFAGFLERSADWDDLLARTDPGSIFLDTRWLTAFARTYCQPSEVRLALLYRENRAVAAGLFRRSEGGISLLGEERSDYCDIPIDANLDDASAAHALASILDFALEGTGVTAGLNLRRLRSHSRAFRLLTEGKTGYRTTLTGSVDAPAMCMSFAPEALRKKSLKRHANGLARKGCVELGTYTRAADILPRLDTLFRLHIGRWADTGSPSLFVDETHRAFYRTFVQSLDASGKLRYSSVALDGEVVAVHLGFSEQGVFTWYKPAFDVALAKLSPGEVLLKYVIEQALEEGVREFDFTIGDEGYKSRFATETRLVHDVHATRSRVATFIRRARTRSRQWLAIAMRRGRQAD